MRLICPLILLAGVGCSSVKSTFFDREPTTNQNITAKLNGYPITLRVPTHLRITLYSNTLLYQPGLPPGKTADATTPTGWQVAKVDGAPIQTVSYGIQQVETTKIFTVDHLRAAAGQTKFDIDFTKDQYIAAISSATRDDTIRQAGIASSRAIRLLTGIDLTERSAQEMTGTLTGSQAAFTPLTGVSKNLREMPEEMFIGTVALSESTNTKTLSSVLNSAMFSIDDPQLETNISCFLRDSMHCCNH